jgi:hypothetical protein
MQVPLEWKLSVSGNNEVKSVMNDLSSAFQRGQISSSEFADSQAKLAREAQKTNNASRYQNQIFLSMHPNLNKLSRGFSTFSSIMRSTIALMTSINTLILAQNSTSSQEVDLLNQKAEAERGLRNARNPEEAQKWAEILAVINAKLKENSEQKTVQWWESWANVLSGIALPAAYLMKGHLGDIAKFIGTNGALLKAGGIFALIATGVALAAEEMYKFVFNVKDMDAWRAANGKMLVDFFTVSIPQALVSLVKFFQDSWFSIATIVQNVINGILGGFVDLINGVINAINRIELCCTKGRIRHNIIIRESELHTNRFYFRFIQIPNRCGNRNNKQHNRNGFNNDRKRIIFQS